MSGRKVTDLDDEEMAELQERYSAGEPLGHLRDEFGLNSHLALVKYGKKAGWPRDFVDKAAMELDYRKGILTDTQIAKKYKTSRQMLDYCVNAGGWERDLAKSIRERAEAKVQIETARAVDARIDDMKGELLEDALIEANSYIQANIISEHRVGASTARDTAVKLLRQMGALAIPEDQLQNFIEVAARTRVAHIENTEKREAAFDKAISTFAELIGLGSRSATMKNLVNALTQAVDLERRVYGIKDEAAETDVTKALRELAANV